MSTLTEFQSGLAVGVVESVSPDAIEVVLTTEAPHGTALNSRALTRFPRLNGHVVIPSETGAVLGLVTWLGVVADRFRPPTDQTDVIQLAAPRRRMRVLPLGTVEVRNDQPAELRRGVLLFPTVGDPVLLPTREQLETLVLQPSEDNVRIGTAPLAGGAVVRVDPDRMLGRHLAILGNTGSGKSCSAALFLRRTIEAATPRACVVVLDANGEYQNSFDDIDGLTVRRFAVEPTEGEELLRVPAWLWNSREWVAFSGAQRGAQAPYLRQALRLLRRGGLIADPQHARVATIARSFHTHVRRQGLLTAGLGDTKAKMDAGRYVELIDSSFDALAGQLAGSASEDLLRAVCESCSEIRTAAKDGKWWNPIDLSMWDSLRLRIEEVLDSYEAGVGDSDVHEDDPTFFFVNDVADAIELAALDDDGGAAVQWMAPLVFRMRQLLNDRRLRAIAGSVEGEDLEGLLGTYLAPGQVSVIDLSLVPTAARSVLVAVFGRLVFEAHERYRRTHGRPLATVLLTEEAHSFIARSRSRFDDDSPASAVDLCREAFERIAREGRKFGLSLVVTSQRPAELSETVLSQCNTFLIHRVVNDVDQALLRRLVPDALGDLLDELPSLPARSAVLLGWASEVPMLLSVDELEIEHRPRSEDPIFTATWRDSTQFEWGRVADAWRHDQGDAASPAADTGTTS